MRVFLAGDETALYLDYGYSYMTMHLWQLLELNTVTQILLCKIFLKRKSEKKKKNGNLRVEGFKEIFKDIQEFHKYDLLNVLQFFT